MKTMLTLLSNCPYARPFFCFFSNPFFISISLPLCIFCCIFLLPFSPQLPPSLLYPWCLYLVLTVSLWPFPFLCSTLVSLQFFWQVKTTSSYLFSSSFSTLLPFILSFQNTFPFSPIFPSVSPTLPCNCVPFLLFPINYFLFPLLSIAVPIIVSSIYTVLLSTLRANFQLA